MSPNEMEQLFWGVFKCGGEDELHELVSTNERFIKPENWYPYGGRDAKDRSNFSIIENQQDNSGAALVEKITNSIDALLLKRCKQEGIDPKSEEAPQTIEAAAERFFGVTKGDLAEMSGHERTSLARDNIQLIATGDTKYPDLLVYDNGEGQHPDAFSDTFLSLMKNNKTDIPFVQGKYNMGSTGALMYCGRHQYQLIASKRDTALFEQQRELNQISYFGWTLVRRHSLSDDEGEQYRSSWYEYFAIDGANIPRFAIDAIDLGLYQKQFSTGTIIKLYSYEMPRGTTDTIVGMLYHDLNQLLYRPALPFWLLESREKYKTFQRQSVGVYGNHVRLNDPEGSRERLEFPPIYRKIESREIGEVTALVIVLKAGKDAKQGSHWRSRFIGSGRNVVYTLHGQAQGHEGLPFISQNLELHFIKESMLIIIECSKLKNELRSIMFMGNRSHIRNKEKIQGLKQSIIEVIRSDERLRKLNNARKEALLRGASSAEEEALIKRLVSKVASNSNLSRLLKKRFDYSHPPAPSDVLSERRAASAIPSSSQRFPSIFTINLKEQERGRRVKAIPLNGKGTIEFETDVSEDYFYRPYDRGEFLLQLLGGQQREDSAEGGEVEVSREVTDLFEVQQTNPQDGVIKLVLKPTALAGVGDEVALNARLTSPDGDLEAIFYVKITDPHKPSTAKKARVPQKIDIPRIDKISKDRQGNWRNQDGEKWEVEGWDEHSALKVYSDGDGIDTIAINTDSYCLKRYLSQMKRQNRKTAQSAKELYISKVFMHSLFLYSILENIRIQDEREGGSSHTRESSDELVARIFRDYGEVLVNLDASPELIESLASE